MSIGSVGLKVVGIVAAFTIVVFLLAPSGSWAQQPSNTATDAEDSVPTTEPVPWQFSLKPYVFLSGLSGSITTGGVTFPINSSFAELVDNLRVGGFLSLVGTKEQWGFLADINYISLQGTSSGQVPIELRLDTLIGEIDATYSPVPGSDIRFVAGARLFDVGPSLRVSDTSILESATTVIDPIVGAVGDMELGENWSFRMRGDIGGFGVSSEFTYQLMLELQWRISGSVGIPLGYRVLSYQITKDTFSLDTRLSGLFLGLDYRF